MNNKRFLKALGLIIVVALLAAALPLQAKAQTGGNTLYVAEWSDPVQLENVTGRETVLFDGTKYHMWYSPSDTTIYHTSSAVPNSFPAVEATEACTFTGGTPKEVGSVSVVKEGDKFYMITYEKSDGTEPTKKFAIYTSSDGNAWSYGGVVFAGAGLPAYSKVDGPFLFKDGATYRLYFQVRTGTGANERYHIYAAESSTIGGIYTLVNGGNPVLSPDPDITKWDGKYVMHPWVVKDGDVYYMWYSAHKGTNPQLIGFAYSSDGYNWVKSPGNPILKTGTGVNDAEPSVIKDGDTWLMWYDEASSNTVKYLTATGPFEFSSIQSAVNVASAGYTVNVAAGEYTEQVVIDKNLTLEGAGASSTIIKATRVPDKLQIY